MNAPDPNLEIFTDLEQRSDDWYDARRGVLTASAIGTLLTSTLKVASNDTSRSLTLQLIAERLTGYTDPTYTTSDMERGIFDEPDARDYYRKHHADVDECAFMIRTHGGVRIGYSPDGLVGDDGLIEIKSRRQKKQLATILSGEVPMENMAQLQAGLWVSGRTWIDFVSYCSGMPLYVIRVKPDPEWVQAILDAAAAFEATARLVTDAYSKAVDGLPVTKRTDMYEEIRV